MSEDVNETPVFDEPVEEPVGDPWAGPAGDEVRSTRDALIASTDWMVLPDSPFQRSMPNRAAVWLYRQKLRDITESCADPADVVWPEAPVL